MALTKNQQTMEKIREMAGKAFQGKEIRDCQELTEGMCNVAYRITFTDGSNTILKIAAADTSGYMTNEIHLMSAEVKAMELAEKALPGMIAQVYEHDASKTLCSGEYFFMQVLEGENFFLKSGSMSEEEKSEINKQIGRLVRRLATISGEYFGLLGDEEHRFRTQYEFLRYLLSNVTMDADRKEVEYFTTGAELLALLERDKHIFDEVTVPAFVHYDMWEGNVFIKGQKVTGIIDWERALFGEPLMEDRFRRHTRNAAFLRGYGQESFTESEMRRIYWYDVLLYLTMMTEGKYRGYADDSQYQWVAPLFQASLAELQ
ncbi:MAG: aminoglycoside phosphotransferase family protein [Lachnospiraceae bacterium]|nr:aminoglycoside phosphotransferase family protein [Lachnospiraceae bacterium]